MQEYTAKIGKNGRVVIPAPYRHLLHLDEGVEVVIRIHDEEIRIFSLKIALKKAKNLVQQHAKNKSLVKHLKDMRLKDSEHE